MIANTFDNARTIDKTVAANFLRTDTFKEMLLNSISNDIFNGTFDISKVEKGICDTEDFDKLKSVLSKSSLNVAEFEKAAEIAAAAFEFEPTQGAWAIVSKNFIEATQPTSRIECIVSDTVNMERTWAAVEILQHLINYQTVNKLVIILSVNERQYGMLMG